MEDHLVAAPVMLLATHPYEAKFPDQVRQAPT
jgi:hypothetical protein